MWGVQFNAMGRVMHRPVCAEPHRSDPFRGEILWEKDRDGTACLGNYFLLSFLARAAAAAAPRQGGDLPGSASWHTNTCKTWALHRHVQPWFIIS